MFGVRHLKNIDLSRLVGVASLLFTWVAFFGYDSAWGCKEIFANPKDELVLPPDAELFAEPGREGIYERKQGEQHRRDVRKVFSQIEDSSDARNHRYRVAVAISKFLHKEAGSGKGAAFVDLLGALMIEREMANRLQSELISALFYARMDRHFRKIPEAQLGFIRSLLEELRDDYEIPIDPVIISKVTTTSGID